MLQRVAVCGNVLQCVAMCCSVLQCVAVCCNVLQCVPADHTCVCILSLLGVFSYFSRRRALCSAICCCVYCSTMCCCVLYCNVLPRVVVYCSALLCVVMYCSALIERDVHIHTQVR